MSKTKDFSERLAEEILSRSPLNIGTIAEIIETRLNIHLVEILNERRCKEEAEYLNLLNQQSKFRVGTIQYNEIGQKIALVKKRKAAANQAYNNIKKENVYKKLKAWVYDKFGSDALYEFTSKNEYNEN